MTMEKDGRTAEEHLLPGPAIISSRSQGASGAGRWARLSKLVRIVILSFCTFALVTDLLGRYHGQHADHKNGKVNVILMISDGYGPASETFARSFYQALEGNTSPNAHFRMPLDKILRGSHRSRSSDSLITDSAAGATAFACAKKSYNGAIGVDDKARPCKTVFEAAKEEGWLTGVVVTSRLTDATPASFIAHVPSRAQESDIAEQALGFGGHLDASIPRPLDLAIGGGGCYFLPKSHPASCRTDEQDLVSSAQEKGWNTKVVFEDKEHPTIQGNTSLPILSLLAPFNTPYEIDRLALSPTKRLPSLASLSRTALNLLHKSSENERGFLLMIEGSQIDLCAHQNDPACHAREILAYQQAIEEVVEWVKRRNDEGERTVVISTSDHETGGVTLGRQLGEQYPNYAYYPQYLLPVKQSAASLSARLLAFARTAPIPDQEAIISFIRSQTLGKEGLALDDSTGGPATEDEVHRVLTCLNTTPSSLASEGSQTMNMNSWTYDHGFNTATAANTAMVPPIDPTDDCRKTIADISSRRAQIGWSTSGHTGVDVPVHASGYRSEALTGNMENTEIGTFIAQTLGLKL